MKKYEKLAASFLALILIITFILPSRAKAEDIGYTWAKQTVPGAGSSTVSTASITDSSGNVYSVGAFSATVDFDPGAGVANLVSASMSQDIFIHKLDASGNYVWAKHIGGGNADGATAVTLDSSGNIYVTGNFMGSPFTNVVDFDPGAGTVNLSTNAYTSATFVLKLDTNGDYVWAKKFSGVGYSGGFAVKVGSDGAVYTTGTFQSTVDFDPGVGTVNLVSTGNDDIFISKLDSNGDYVLAKKAGGGGPDTARSLVLDSSNNPIITGEFNGTVDFDPGAGTSDMTASGYIDVFVLKLDVNGDYVFSKTFQGSSISYGKSVALDTSGNIYMTGFFTGTVDFDPGAGTTSIVSTGNDMFVSKIDASGNYIWAKRVGVATSETKANAVTVDGSGNAYITGTFGPANIQTDFDPGDGTAFLQGTSNKVTIFALKLDASGNYAWAKGFAVGGDPSSISLYSDTIYISGYFQNSQSDFDPGAGTANLSSNNTDSAFVAKFTTINATPVASNVAMTTTASTSPFPQYGVPITASYTYSDAESDPEGATIFEWNVDGIGAVPGETSSTFTPRLSDVGKAISLTVTPVASTGTSTGVPVSSAVNYIIQPAPPTFSPVTVSSITMTSATFSTSILETGGTLIQQVYFIGEELGLQGMSRGFTAWVDEPYAIGVYEAGEYSASTNDLRCGTNYSVEFQPASGQGTPTQFSTPSCPGAVIIPIPKAPDPVIEEPKEEVIQPKQENEIPPKEETPVAPTAGSAGTSSSGQIGGGSSSAPAPGVAFVGSLPQVVPEDVRTQEVKPIGEKDSEEPTTMSTQTFGRSLRLAIQSDQPLQQILSADPVVVQTAETINTVVVATAVAVPLTGAVATSAYAFSDMFFTLLRLWNGALSSLGIRKKRRPWGTVYDSQTKQPLDPAYVALTDSTGKEVASALTDIDGRYGFVVPAGQYTLSVRKTHYTFPSKKLSSSSDELYTNLYYGTPITVATDGAVIMHNIPLDRDGFDWNEYVKQTQGRLTFFRARDLLIARISSFFFIIGGILSFLSLFLVPTTLNIIVLCIYVLLALLRIFSRAGKAKGSLMTKNGAPLPFAILRFLSKDSGQEVAHAISDRSGLYYALVPNGSYSLVVEEKRKGGYEKKFTRDVVVKNGMYAKEIRE